VLELGAGTGRLTAALAARGLKVTGVDIAPTMLVQAKARLAQLSAEIQARIELRHADMTTLDLRRAFDLVVCPFFTLAHVPAGAAWRNTFATAARHLGPGGLAAFHLPRLDLMRRPVAPHPSRPVMDQPLRDGGRLLLFVRERTFNEAVGRLDQVLDYVVADGAGHIVRRSTERLTYWMTAPEPLAADAGLSLDRPPIDVGGAGDIWVFRK
jgi:SAM-dependent methyltransferase